MTSNNLKKQFTQIISSISNGARPEFSLSDIEAEVKQLPEGDDKDLFNAILHLSQKNNESQHFILELSKGNIHVEAPKNNQWIAAYKQLHANLKHLVWKIQRISEGDLNQDIDYLGDLSLHFNKLIHSLKEKSQFERALKKSKQKLKTIIETSPDGIAITDLKGKVQFVTSKVVSQWGYQTASEIIGKNVLDFVHPSYHEKASYFIGEMIKGNLSGAIEFLMIRKNGTSFYNETNSNVLRDENDQPIGVLYIERDVTQRKEIEELISQQIEQLSRLNTNKDKFFKIIAHDLKNPFNTIIGLSKLLSDNALGNDWEGIQKCAQSISEAADHTYNLLENLLEWSQLQSNGINAQPVTFKPSELISKVVAQYNPMALSKNITLRYHLDSNKELWADKDMIATVLRNMVSNALKFTKALGRVEISTQQVGHRMQFEVSDTGIGIRKEDLCQVFHINRKLSETGTANETGTGLGLILCKEFIKKNNGKLWVNSERGKGSQFIFTVPLKQIPYAKLSDYPSLEVPCADKSISNTD